MTNCGLIDVAGPKRLKRYAHVIAYTENDCPDICFFHHFIDAADDEDAYTKGNQVEVEGEVGTVIHLVNDYVFEAPNA
jgi:hypothetical protein